MIRINLVPEKVRSAEHLRRNLALGILAVLAVGVAIGFLYYHNRQDLVRVRAEVASVQAEMNSPQLRKIVQAVEEFSADRKNLDDQQSLVDKLRERQIRLVKLMDMLPDLIPDEVWLTDLTTTFADGKKRVSVRGNATNAEAFARFYANLENQGLKNLAIDGQPTAAVVLGTNVVGFSVSFDFEG